MRRCVMLCLTLIAMSACTGEKLVRPSDAPTSPSSAISDGNHCETSGPGCLKGNPDFFFLPPMVKNPSSSSDWQEGTFNADLEPTVEICASAATTAANVGTAACPVTATLVATVESGTEQYQVNWQVPNDASTIFYRVKVIVGTKTLGFADLETGSSAAQLKKVDTGELIPLVDGRTLPIKFRVERFALCAVPGIGPCATKAIDVFGAGGKVSTALVATKEEGIIFASNPTTATASAFATSTTTGKRTVTVERCDDFRDRGITDLPTFGPCVRVRVEPALSSALTAPALVYSCDVTIASATATVSRAQAERIAMHRLVGTALEALPHDHPDCSTSTSAAGSVRGMFADLRQGRLKSAARQMVAMLTPKPLYAARFIDLGGGGSTRLSDETEGVGRSLSATKGARLTVSPTSPTHHEFQFLLPAKFEFIETPLDRAAYPADQVQVSVKVTDLGDEPVMNARVRFSAGQGGAVSDAIAFTSSDAASRGIATVTWTVTPPSPNILTVTGRGIAGENEHGPRIRTATKVDPFQPCDEDWEVVGSALACVEETNAPTGLGTGTMVLTATTVGDIAGRAIDEQTGAPVAVGVAYTPSATGASTAAGDGTFLIKDVTPGTRAVPQSYSLTLSAPNFQPRTRAGVLVEPKVVTQLGDICLTPVPGAIAGTLVNSFDNAAVSQPVTVTATETAPSIAPQCPGGGTPPAPIVRTVTTSDGSFSLGNLPPGTYSLATSSTGYFAKSIAVVVVSANATTSLGGVSLVPYVTSTSTVDLPTFTGSCATATVFTFTGTITSAVAGDVTLKWLRSDGAIAQPDTINFAAPGTQTVQTTWTMSAGGTHWQQLQILSPTDTKSNQSSFTLTCTSP